MSKNLSASFYVEAGYAGMNLRGEQLPVYRVPRPPEATSERSAIPFLLAGIGLPGRLSPVLLQIGYYHVGTAEADVRYPVLFHPPWDSTEHAYRQVLSTIRFRDRIRAVTLGPQISYALSERITMAGSFGGVYVRATQSFRYLNPPFGVPGEWRQTPTQTGIRPFGRASMAFNLAGDLDLLASYTYLDLSPSWSRKADLLGLSLRFGF